MDLQRVRENGKDSDQEIIENYIYLTPEEMEQDEIRIGEKNFTTPTLCLLSH